MPATFVKPKWGRYYRCESGHGFYSRDGRITRVTRSGGGRAPDDIPCGICGEQSFARGTDEVSGVAVSYRRCFAGHVGVHRLDTGEFLRRSLTPEDWRVTECHDCGADVSDIKSGRCDRCDMRRTRARRVYRAEYECPCGRPTASMNTDTVRKREGRCRVRECAEGHRSLWKRRRFIDVTRETLRAIEESAS